MKHIKLFEQFVNEKDKETTEAEGRNWKVGTLDHPKFGTISTFNFMANDEVRIYLSTKQSLEDQDNFIITAFGGSGAYNTAWSLNDKNVKKLAKKMQDMATKLQGDSFMNIGASGYGKYKGKDVKLKDYVDAIEAWVELRDSLLSESVVTESEAENILQDLLDERGGDMGELYGMEMEDALDTVEAYGHKGSKAKKIAQELHSLCNESVVNEAKFKKGQYIKAKRDSDDFDGDVYDKTNDVDGSEILKNSSFEIYEIGKDEVILWSDADEVEYSIDPDDLKNFVKESVVTEAVNASGYIKAGKLGYNDQFLGRRSLSYTLSTDLGLDPKNEFIGPWLGFDHVSLYATGKNGGTILDDALTGKYTYDELKDAAAKHLGL